MFFFFYFLLFFFFLKQPFESLIGGTELENCLDYNVDIFEDMNILIEANQGVEPNLNPNRKPE